MKKKIVIIGAGGFGREVLDIFDACNQNKPDYDVLGFIVEAKYGAPGTIVNDKLILGDFNWLEQYKNEVYVICAVGLPHLRQRLVQKANKVGCRFCSIIHPNTILTRWVKIGEGVIISAGCILTNQIYIENHVQINLDCTIGHNTILHNFSTLAPGVHISGNVTIGDGSYIGTGVNIIEKLSIGEWSVVGAGSTIIRDVPPNTTVVGLPGKVIKIRDPDGHLTDR